MKNYQCNECHFQLYIPIAELSCSMLGLYDDNRFPGRCIVVLKNHWEDLATLHEAQARSFLTDIQTAGQAIQSAVQASRINYAILGNVQPHLHAHLIPRKPVGDPIPEQSPWKHPLPPKPLEQSLKESLIAAIRNVLKSPQGSVST